MNKQIGLLVLGFLTFAGAASADTHDYVCGVIDAKITEAETTVSECMSCAEAAAYFIEFPLDDETTFATCTHLGGYVDWVYPYPNWEPWEEVPLLVDDCIAAMDRAERLNTLYDANCL